MPWVAAYHRCWRRSSAPTSKLKNVVSHPNGNENDQDPTQLVLGALIAVAVTVLINTFIIQACWNYFVPAVFTTVPQITFFQAMVLAVGIRALKGNDVVSFNKKES